MIEGQVKLFRNGRNQAVRIPREFELPGRAAAMRKEGERLIIEPAPPRSLLASLASWDDLGKTSASPNRRPAAGACRSVARLNRLLLDTDILFDLVAHPKGRVAQRIVETRPFGYQFGMANILARTQEGAA